MSGGFARAPKRSCSHARPQTTSGQITSAIQATGAARSLPLSHDDSEGRSPLSLPLPHLIHLPLFDAMNELISPPQKEDPHNDHPLYWRNTKGGLFEEDFFWREHQQWLADAGYMLRPRYREDWEPSWLKSGKANYQCEDGKSILVSNIGLLLSGCAHIVLL